jgi:hypothetical protein
MDFSNVLPKRMFAVWLCDRRGELGEKSVWALILVRAERQGINGNGELQYARAPHALEHVG